MMTVKTTTKTTKTTHGDWAGNSYMEECQKYHWLWASQPPGYKRKRNVLQDSVFSATKQMATLFMGGKLYMLFWKFFPRFADWDWLVRVDIGFLK